MNSKLLLNAIRRIFSNWTALQMAIENGMGTNSQAQQFCEYMVEFMDINDQLHVTDVAKEIEGYLDDIFNTVAEDGSINEVAQDIIKFNGYCKSNEVSLVYHEMQLLPPLQSWITSPMPSTRSLVKSAESDTSNDEDGDNKMDIVNDDWVEVKTRRRK